MTKSHHKKVPFLNNLFHMFPNLPNTVGFFILDRYWNCFFEASRTARVTKNIYLESRFLQFLEFQIKKISNFSSSNSSSILKKSKYFFSKQRQKLQKSYIRCTWFCQSSSSGSFRKPASLPIKYDRLMISWTFLPR